MRKRNKLVHGVGINNADYETQKFFTLEGKKKLIWICPFYLKWKAMLGRCYSEKYKQNKPTYSGCSVIPEWHYFMNFRAWMETQEWEGKQLDKDILLPSNKEYGPDTCVFVDLKTNSFLNEKQNARGQWPIGLYFDKKRGKFKSQCKDIITGKEKFLGYYDDPQSAHKAWLTFKLEQAYILAAEQTDPRVAAALIDRYENYAKYFGTGD